MLLRPLLKKFECETLTDTVDSGALVNRLVSLLSNYGTTALLADIIVYHLAVRTHIGERDQTYLAVVMIYNYGNFSS